MNREIYTLDRTREEIDAEVNRYLTLENVGKYLIFRDDDGNAQTNTYIGRKIINEAARGDQPLISLSSTQDEVELNVYNILRGGKTKKMKKTKKRKNMSRSKSRSRSRRNKRNKSKGKKRSHRKRN